MSRTGVDYTGRKKGRFTVLCRAGRRGKDLLWRCRCECGTIKTLTASRLVPSATTNSCGCLFQEYLARCKLKPHRYGPEYRTWNSMKQRCANPKNLAYPRYGERGITVCTRWHDFDDFFQDMGARPAAHMSIDRINNDGNYEPKNCRWATPRQQRTNQRAPRYSKQITYKGVTQHGAAWDRQIGLPSGKVAVRLKTGWSIEDAVTLPAGSKNPQGKKMITANGRTMTRRAWAAELGVTPAAITLRIKNGWSPEEAVTVPNQHA